MHNLAHGPSRHAGRVVRAVRVVRVGGVVQLIGQPSDWNGWRDRLLATADNRRAMPGAFSQSHHANMPAAIDTVHAHHGWPASRMGG